MARWSGAIATVLLGACATTSPGSAADAGAESISYETGPCFGACPVYRVTVHADGGGLFEGRRFTSVVGQRAFRVTSDQYRAFARRLEPLRPASGAVRYDQPPRCASMATDLPSTDVKWRTRDGREQELYFYHGCDMEKNRAIAERLVGAPDLLPVAAMIRAER
jgi:hypothetical protein